MSYTRSIGAVGAEYWSNMAIAMSNILGNIRKSGEKIQIPRGIWYDARKFFRLVLGEKTGDTMFNNHLAQLNAHVIAWEALGNCGGFRCKTRKEADGYFTRFATLLDELNENRATEPLNQEWLKTAEEFQRFFFALHQLGT